MAKVPYRIVLAEAATGVVLNADGSWHLSGHGPQWEPTFDALAEALTLKDRLLDQFPFAEVNIVGGPEGFEPLRFTAQPRA
jgi:hypothetical protein